MPLQDHIKSLLVGGIYSDLTITCNGREWKVHKCIVCCQSSFFNAAMQFGGKETIESKIDLPEDDPVIVDHMIQYLYSTEYSLPSDAENTWWFRMDWDSWDGVQFGSPDSTITAKTKRDVDEMMWRLSTKMKLQVLIEFPDVLVDANQKIITLKGNEVQHCMIYDKVHNTEDEWADHPERFPLPINSQDAMIHARVYALADKYGISDLQDEAETKFKASLENRYPDADFFDVVKEVFTTTPDTDPYLREAVAEYIDKSRKVYGMFEGLDEHLKGIPDLAYHVAKCAWRDMDE